MNKVKSGDTHEQGEFHVKMRQRSGDASPTKEHPRLPWSHEKRRDGLRVSLTPLRRSQACWHLDLKPLSLQNHEAINTCCLSHSLCGTLLQQSPRKVIQLWVSKKILGALLCGMSAEPKALYFGSASCGIVLSSEMNFLTAKIYSYLRYKDDGSFVYVIYHLFPIVHTIN